MVWKRQWEDRHQVVGSWRYLTHIKNCILHQSFSSFIMRLLQERERERERDIRTTIQWMGRECGHRKWHAQKKIGSREQMVRRRKGNMTRMCRSGKSSRGDAESADGLWDAGIIFSVFNTAIRTFGVTAEDVSALKFSLCASHLQWYELKLKAFRFIYRQITFEK